MKLRLYFLVLLNNWERSDNERNVISFGRKKKHGNDDFGIEECWKKITEILSQNEDGTIDYLNNCSKEDLYYRSEVFEDIPRNLKSDKIFSFKIANYRDV